MKRKIQFFLCILSALLLVLPASLASVDLSAADRFAGLAVIYVPGTRNQNEVDTAVYIKEALCARFSSQKHLVKSMNSGNIKEEADSSIFRVMGGDGGGTLKEKIYEELMSTDYQLWFLIPEEAADGFWANQALADQLRSLTENRIMQVHAVIIGDGMKEPTAEAMTLFASETGKLDRTWVASTFTGNSQRTEANRLVATGIYFTAGLYGTAVEVPVYQEGETLSFTLGPDAGKVLVIAQAKKKNQKLEITAENEGTNIEIKPNNKPGYYGLLLEELYVGKHTASLTGDAETVRIYHYPDMDNYHADMHLSTETADRKTVRRGLNELSLRMDTVFGRPENLQVQFKCTLTGTDGTEDVQLLSGQLDPEDRMLWKAEIQIGPDDQELSVTPVFTLNTPDGNAVRDWQGEEQRWQAADTEVNIKDGAPGVISLYYDWDHVDSKAGCGWDLFFDYNPEDRPGPSITAESRNLAEGMGFVFEETADGFSVSFPRLPAADGEDTADVSASIVLSCGDKFFPLLFHAVNVEALGGQIVFTADQEQTGVGGAFTVKAALSADTAGKYLEAHEIYPDYPALQQMSARLEKMNGDLSLPEDPVYFTENGDGSWSAEMQIPVPALQPAGTVEFRCVVREDGNPEKALAASDGMSVQIVNTAPELKNEPENLKQTMEAAGLPKEWANIGILKTIFGEGQEISLLQTALGSEDLFSLYTDAETDAAEVRVSVEPADGLALPKGIGSTEGGRWTAVLKKDAAAEGLKILAGPPIRPTDYTIRVSASDGVNDSPETEAVLTISSAFVRTALYAGAGLAALILLIVLVLIIRQVRKPGFDSVNVRCLVSSDTDEEQNRQLMSLGDAVPLKQFGKKPAPLSHVLIMSRQPPLSPDTAKIVEDITLMPSRHDEILVLFGKTALHEASSHAKKEHIPLGETYRLRLGDTYILIEYAG